MTAISPPSLLQAPHIVEQGPSAILADRPLEACQGSLVPLEFLIVEAGPSANLLLIPQFCPHRSGTVPGRTVLVELASHWSNVHANSR